LHIEVDAVEPWKTGDGARAETSAEIRARVVAARRRQNERSMRLFGREILNARLDGKRLDQSVPLDEDSLALLNKAAEKMGLSARGYNRIKRIARTIADLRGADDVGASDIAEALSYRPVNRGRF
jgi:magnesium chelatase family protein